MLSAEAIATIGGEPQRWCELLFLSVYFTSRVVCALTQQLIDVLSGKPLARRQSWASYILK